MEELHIPKNPIHVVMHPVANFVGFPDALKHPLAAVPAATPILQKHVENNNRHHAKLIRKQVELQAI